MNRTLIHIHLKKMGADQPARLLSGRDFVASTVGYAPLSSMCDVSRSGAAASLGPIAQWLVISPRE